MGFKTAIFAVFAFVCLIILVTLNPLVKIDEGYLAFGAYKGEVLNPGLHWRTPIVEDVVKMEVRTQKPHYENLVAFSYDKQDIFVNATVNYHLAHDAVGTIYAEFGDESDVEEKLIFPSVQQLVKQEFNKLKADEIVRKREELRAIVLDELRKQLSPYDVTVTDFYLENIDFSQQYKAAIEKAQIAEQQRIEQENVTAQEEERKKQQILKAEALAERTRLEAEALRVQGDKVIEKIYAEAALKAAEKWDGKLPGQFVPGSTLPILNLKTQ